MGWIKNTFVHRGMAAKFKIMKEVTHIPHQHIKYITGLNKGTIIILTKNPNDGKENTYMSDISAIDEKGLHGKFIKVS